MTKFAQNVEMSLAIPESELEQANVLIDLLKLLVRRLDNFDKYLDNLYNPFKEHEKVSKKSVLKYRGTLWRYTEEIEKDFGQDEEQTNKIAQWSIKKLALICASKLDIFSSDTQVSKLLKTFSDDISNVEENVEGLVKAIRNYEAADFRNAVVNSLESMKKEIIEFIKIIEERIIDYINTNILAKNWVEDSGKDLGVKPQIKEPYVVKLYKERNKR